MGYKDKEKQKVFQNEWAQNRRLSWIGSQGGKCVQCGSSEELEVDHINPADKVTHRVWTLTQKKREAELAKCQVLCHVCHQEKTRAEKTKPLVHGTSNGYRKRNCRCGKCRGWNAEDSRRKRAAQRARQLASL